MTPFGARSRALPRLVCEKPFARHLGLRVLPISHGEHGESIGCEARKAMRRRRRVVGVARFQKSDSATGR